MRSSKPIFMAIPSWLITMMEIGQGRLAFFTESRGLLMRLIVSRRAQVSEWSHARWAKMVDLQLLGLDKVKLGEVS